jgi:hypothetical protein
MTKVIGMTAIFAVALTTAAMAQVALPDVSADTATPTVTPFVQPSPPPGNSQPGLPRYLDNPGRQQATAVGAQCGSGAGSGAFGYFGKDNNLGIKSDPTDPGANGHKTGVSNSSVCGNRQGNLP